MDVVCGELVGSVMLDNVLLHCVSDIDACAMQKGKPSVYSVL